MNLSNKNTTLKSLTFLYFLNATVEVIAEYYNIKYVVFITKPLISVILIAMYFVATKSNSKLFYSIVVLSLITNLLFIPNTASFLFYGIVFFTLHRFFLMLFIYKTIKNKSLPAFILSALPIGFIFFYLFSATELPENSFYLILFHNIVAAVLGGFAISAYIINDNKQNSLLLISVLLFLGLQLVIYIEKYYFVQSHSDLLRPLAMMLNIFAFYVFYKFAIASEVDLNDN